MYRCLGTRRSILGELTQLVGHDWPQARAILGHGHESSHSHQIEAASGQRWGQVHHYWEQGLAVHTDVTSRQAAKQPGAEVAPWVGRGGPRQPRGSPSLR